MGRVVLIGAGMLLIGVLVVLIVVSLGVGVLYLWALG
jgi:hypothetical protein